MSTKPFVAEPAESVVDDEKQHILREKNQAAIDLLRELREVDEAGRREQLETWQALERALGEERNSYGKLF